MIKVSHHISIPGSNIERKLIDKGVVRVTGTGKDYKGDSITTAVLDRKLCDPDGWDKLEKRIKEAGVVTFGDPAKKLEDDGSVLYSIAKWQSKKGNALTYDDLTKLPAEELDELKAQFKVEEVDAFTQIGDLKYRRDYRPEEIEKLSQVPVQFHDNGSKMMYFTTWKSDPTTAVFVSAALEKDMLVCKSFAEGKPDWSDNMKAGQSCTSDGKPYYGIMNVVGEAVRPNPKNPDQSIVRFHYGKNQKSCMIYVDNSDIEQITGYNNKPRALVYLTNENYKAYGLDSKTAKMLSAQGIMSGYDTARSAFRDAMSTRETETANPAAVAPRSSERSVPNDLDAVMANSGTLPEDDGIPFD